MSLVVTGEAGVTAESPTVLQAATLHTQLRGIAPVCPMLLTDQQLPFKRAIVTAWHII